MEFEGNFDIVILGTGIKESILSGILSVSGRKVLHLDRNNYYGGESASLNLDQLFAKFRDGAATPENLGKSSKYCVDLCPKYLMASGTLVNVLVSAGVTNYLEFRSVAGSYVFHKNKKIHKVPSTLGEAMTCGLLGLLEMNRFRTFLNFNAAYEEDQPATHKTSKGSDINAMPAEQLFKEYKLSKDTQTFTGHAICLYSDEEYLKQAAVDVVSRAKLYAYSVAKYGNSPYIYPRYGLGGLPEGFSRRCAVYGGVFMLNMSQADPFIQEITYDDGKVTGLVLGADVCQAYEISNPQVTCQQLVADPSYFIGTDKVRQTSQIARCICIMSKPIPLPGANEDSAQIIMPGSNMGRKNDIYVCMNSFNHDICAEGKYVAVMSCLAEIDGDAEANLAPALNLLEQVDEKFAWMSDYYEPTGDGSDNCFITASMDPTTHFQSSMAEVMEMFERITGSPYAPPPPAEAGEAGGAEAET